LGGKGLAKGMSPPEPLEELPVVAQPPSTGNVSIGGSVKDSNIITGSGNTVQTARGSNIAQASGGGTATVNDHSSRSVFDQRGQKVKTQYNIAGDYNPAVAQDRATAVEELRKLMAELNSAADDDALPKKSAVKARQSVENAIVEAEEPKPDKNSILDYLATANEIITTAAGATTLVGAVTQAIQMVQRLF